MISSDRLEATSERYPLGGELPDFSFDLSRGLNGDAQFVNERLRAAAGVTLALATEQIDPHGLGDFVTGRDLDVKVLVVPQELVGVGMPMQFGAAEAELGLYIHGRSLTIDGRRQHNPTSGVEFSWLGADERTGTWVPRRAYTGPLGAYASLPISPVERNESQRGAGYAHLITAAQALGDVATHAVGLLADRDKFGIQVQITRNVNLTPVVPNPETDTVKAQRAKVQDLIFGGAR